jgi:hypothetical protein
MRRNPKSIVCRLGMERCKSLSDGLGARSTSFTGLRVQPHPCHDNAMHHPMSATSESKKLVKGTTRKCGDCVKPRRPRDYRNAEPSAVLRQTKDLLQGVWRLKYVVRTQRCSIWNLDAHRIASSTSILLLLNSCCSESSHSREPALPRLCFRRQEQHAPLLQRGSSLQARTKPTCDESMTS